MSLSYQSLVDGLAESRTKPLMSRPCPNGPLRHHQNSREDGKRTEIHPTLENNSLVGFKVESVFNQ